MLSKHRSCVNAVLVSLQARSSCVMLHVLRQYRKKVEKTSKQAQLKGKRLGSEVQGRLLSELHLPWGSFEATE